jgi:hypothetical protein
MNKAFVTILPSQEVIVIDIYPMRYNLFSDLDLHNYVYDIRKEKNVEVITGNEILKRIRPQLTFKQIATIEKWLFEGM